MAKTILMSIRPEWVAKILNGEKTIEIRKRFPSDYVGWVYIYCTLGQGLVFDSEGKGLVNSKLFPYAKNCPEHNRLINGKVVARFWCDKVEEIPPMYKWKNNYEQELESKGCVTQKELFTYLKMHDANKCGYAIHINDLEIFDKPKEISDFYKVGYENSVTATKKYILCSINREERRKYKTELDLKINNEIAVIKDNYKLTRAPQSWCYIEYE